MDDERIGLSDWIAAIRNELTEAAERQIVRQASAAARGVTQTVQAMQVKEIRLELEVASERSNKSSASGRAGLKFWVLSSASVEAGHERATQRGTTQRLVLTLEPKGLFFGDGSGDEKDLT